MHCEQCASGFTAHNGTCIRSALQLCARVHLSVLGCAACSCNGHSSDCDAVTGNCFSCQVRNSVITFLLLCLLCDDFRTFAALRTQGAELCRDFAGQHCWTDLQHLRSFLHRAPLFSLRASSLFVRNRREMQFLAPAIVRCHFLKRISSLNSLPVWQCARAIITRSAAIRFLAL